ncbi:MAG: PorV/PorQ family protein, partial [Candidatus Zixiibacteriota bacterium]
AQINAITEKLLTNWQDLRFNTEAFSALKENVNSATIDNQLTTDELNRIEADANACETETRPTSIKVPYSVLLTVWRGWEVPWEQRIEKIAVMENGVPSDNYSHYDIWALSNFGLMRYDGTVWSTGDAIEPRRGDNLKDIVSRALGTSKEEMVNPRLEMVARANNSIPLERIREIQTEVQAALPEKFEGREDFLKNLARLEEAWLGCRLDNLRMNAFLDAYGKAYADSTITESEGDRLMFSLEKAFRDRLPAALEFPFAAVFEGQINDIAVDHKTLYAGTTQGLYRYNGRSWEKFAIPGDSSAVWSIRVQKRGVVFVGTETNIHINRDGKWSHYGPTEGVTAGPIKSIYVKNDKLAWAATDNDLFRFDGTNWSNLHSYTTTVNDSAGSLFARFYGPIDQTRIELESARLQAANAEFYANPTAGMVITIPYKAEFEGNITALEMDNDNNLWVGTDLGIKKFDGRAWMSYGYKAIKVERQITIEELAQEYLKTSDPDKINSFVNILKQKNTIQEGSLQMGRVVWVYANPAGSTINSLHSHGGRLYVASIYGTFSYGGGAWERYYHEGLQQANTRDVVGQSGEMWFATSDRIVVFARGKNELAFTHANWLPDLAPDLYYEFLSYTQPFGGLGTIGGNVTFLSYGEIPTTGENSSEVTGIINPFDVAVTLSYGTRASKKLAVGLSAKIIYSKLSVQGAGREVGEGSGTSFAVEGGLLYSISRRLRLGAVITNLGPNMSYIDAAQSDALPRNVALGFAYKLIDSPYNRLTVVGEINKLVATLNDDFATEFQEAVENVGIEYWYGSLLALRAGYIYDKEGQIKTPTLGVGLQYKGKYRLDFAYIPSSENLPLANTLRTSLTVKL